MAESLQHKLDRVRPPRVQITYDVEIGNAMQMKELPFVVGIMADLSGKPLNPLPKLKNRKFNEIDRDNFNEIMKSLNPRLEFTVPNHLDKEKESLAVELYFQNMDSFTPIEIIKQVPDVLKVYQSRVLLKDLITKLDGNDDLEEMLNLVMTDSAQRDAVKAQVAAKKAELAAAAPAGDAAKPAKEGE